MSHIRFILAMFSIVLFAGACGHKQVKFEGAKAFKVSSEANGKGLLAEPTWLKHKEKNIDTEMKLTNMYDFPIQIKQTGITLSYNGEKAVVRQMGRFSNEMAPGVFQMATLIFDMPGHSLKGGKGVVTFNDIYKADGKTKLPALKVDFTIESIEKK